MISIEHNRFESLPARRGKGTVNAMMQGWPQPGESGARAVHRYGVARNPHHRISGLPHARAGSDRVQLIKTLEDRADVVRPGVTALNLAAGITPEGAPPLVVVD